MCLAIETIPKTELLLFALEIVAATVAAIAIAIAIAMATVIEAVEMQHVVGETSWTMKMKRA